MNDSAYYVMMSQQMGVIMIKQGVEEPPLVAIFTITHGCVWPCYCTVHV